MQKMKNDNHAGSKTHCRIIKFSIFHHLRFHYVYIYHNTHMHKHILRGPLNLAVSVSLAASDSLSPASPALAERSVIGPWLAPLCPVINPDPLALGTVGQGSQPNPPHLLLSAMQFGHAKLSPIL